MNLFLSKLNKFFWGLVSHYYAIFLILTISFFAFGFFLLYNDFFLLMQSKPVISLSQIQINDDILEEVLNEAENRKLKIEEIESKEYFNPFEKVFSLTEENENG